MKKYAVIKNDELVAQVELEKLDPKFIREQEELGVEYRELPDSFMGKAIKMTGKDVVIDDEKEQKKKNYHDAVNKIKNLDLSAPLNAEETLRDLVQILKGQK